MKIMKNTCDISMNDVMNNNTDSVLQKITEFVYANLSKFDPSKKYNNEDQIDIGFGVDDVYDCRLVFDITNNESKTQCIILPHYYIAGNDDKGTVLCNSTVIDSPPELKSWCDENFSQYILVVLELIAKGFDDYTKNITIKTRYLSNITRPAMVNYNGVSISREDIADENFSFDVLETVLNELPIGKNAKIIEKYNVANYSKVEKVILFNKIKTFSDKPSFQVAITVNTDGHKDTSDIMVYSVDEIIDKLYYSIDMADKALVGKDDQYQMDILVETI